MSSRIGWDSGQHGKRWPHPLYPGVTLEGGTILSPGLSPEGLELLVLRGEAELWLYTMSEVPTLQQAFPSPWLIHRIIHILLNGEEEPKCQVAELWFLGRCTRSPTSYHFLEQRPSVAAASHLSCSFSFIPSEVHRVYYGYWEFHLWHKVCDLGKL